MREGIHKNYIGYDYQEIAADSNDISRYLDGYINFGWEPDENQSQMKDHGKVILRIKRDRKIINKTELTRLQRNFEHCLKEIGELEKSKKSKATMIALSIGLIGTAFMAGSTFAVTHETPIIWLCILLAIPGFLGWIVPYFVYTRAVARRTEVVNELIEEKYDEIYELCKKGNRILGNERES